MAVSSVPLVALEAERRLGYFATREATRRGISRIDLHRAAEHGWLERPVGPDGLHDARGVWRFVGAPRLEHDRERLVVGFLSASRGDEGYCLALEAAALWWDPSRSLWANPVQLYGPPERRHRIAGVQVIARPDDLQPDDVTTLGGVAVTTVDRTLSDLRDHIHDRDHLRDIAEAWEHHPPTRGALTLTA